jgi:hypothetical protein
LPSATLFRSGSLHWKLLCSLQDGGHVTQNLFSFWVLAADRSSSTPLPTILSVLHDVSIGMDCTANRYSTVTVVTKLLWIHNSSFQQKMHNIKMDLGYRLDPFGPGQDMVVKETEILT